MQQQQQMMQHQNQNMFVSQDSQNNSLMDDLDLKSSNSRIPLGNLRQQELNQLNRANNLNIGDKLTGMMTDKEKNWVVNVQMMQLQIEDPYTYDFYFTVKNIDF